MDSSGAGIDLNASWDSTQLETVTDDKVMDISETEEAKDDQSVTTNKGGGDGDVGDTTDGKVNSKLKSKKLGDFSTLASSANEPDSEKTVDSSVEKTTIEGDDESGGSQEDFVKVDPTELETELDQSTNEDEKLFESTQIIDETEQTEKQEEKPGVVDILGNGSLTKKILVEAPEDADKPQQGNWVEVNYEIYIAGQDKILESEANRKICVHDVDLVQGIDFALMLMKTSEKAEIFMASDKAYGSYGRPEINVPPNTDLKFILTLERICETPEKDELLQIIERKKTRAKELFMAKDYESAVYIYGRCLGHLDAVDMEKSDVGLAIKSNLAQGFLNMQRFDLALQSAITVVNQDPNNTKALLRLGKAYHNLGDLRRAERVLSKAADLEPSNKSILNELNTVKTKSKKSLENQKKIYGKMFGLDKQEKAKKSDKQEGNTQYYVAGAVVAAGLASLGYSLYKSLN